MNFGEAGCSSELNYDEGHGLFRFADGEFAFLNVYANGWRPRELGIMGLPGPASYLLGYGPSLCR